MGIELELESGYGPTADDNLGEDICEGERFIDDQHCKCARGFSAASTSCFHKDEAGTPMESGGFQIFSVERSPKKEE